MWSSKKVWLFFSNQTIELTDDPNPTYTRFMVYLFLSTRTLLVQIHLGIIEAGVWLYNNSSVPNLKNILGCTWIVGKGGLWVRQIVLKNVIYL